MPSGVTSRALVVFPGALGDFICLCPAIERLSRVAAVEVLAKTEYGDLVSPFATVRSLECSEIRRLFVAGASEETPLHDLFDRYRYIYSWFASEVPVFAHQLRLASRGRAVLFPFRSSRPEVHQVDHYLSCLGVTTGAAPRLSVQAEAAAWSESYWRRHGLVGKPVLAIAPGSGAAKKNWPIEFYRVLAGWWRERFAGFVLLILGPVEVERLDLARLPAAVAVRGLPLGRLSALLSRSDLYIGNDSGTTHLAAALGVRTVALFGPSDPQVWAPRGERVTVIRNGVCCSPCSRATMKSCVYRECLLALKPDKVIADVENLPEIASLTRNGVEIRV